MADPSHKDPQMEDALRGVFGFDRRTAIANDTCIPAPIGCGKPAPYESFRNPLSVREYSISGLCQTCQDKVFGADDEE